MPVIDFTRGVNTNAAEGKPVLQMKGNFLQVEMHQVEGSAHNGVRDLELLAYHLYKLKALMIESDFS